LAQWYDLLAASEGRTVGIRQDAATAPGARWRSRIQLPLLALARLPRRSSSRDRRLRLAAHSTRRGRGLSTSVAKLHFSVRLGRTETDRRRSDGMPTGHIGSNPKRSEAESVLWAAENKPDFAGMSHVAECHSSYGTDGWEDVTKVVAVESSDLVVDPATTKG